VAGPQRIGLPTPAAQMREALERQRMNDLPFALAWKRGFERIKWPEEKMARDEWKSTLISSKPVWEASYSRTGAAPRGLSGLTNLFITEPSEHFPTEVLA